MVLGSRIRDPGSGKNLFRIPDPDPQHCRTKCKNIIEGSLIQPVRPRAAQSTRTRAGFPG
jgi:hypothetical protein